MHYTAAGGSPIVPLKRQETLQDQVKEVVERIPSEVWSENREIHPFMQDASPWTIALECLPFCTGELKTDAVYVLECMPNSEYMHTLLRHFSNYNKPWTGEVEGSRRLVYVGMTTNLLRRLDEHLNYRGDKGAHFTTVFRPIRILDVSWYHSASEAAKAERLIAEKLRERFPDDYIYCSVEQRSNQPISLA